MTGYKAMMRDRMPSTLELALRWCKAKQRWIDYVYDNVIKKYPKEKRSIAVKKILGIKQNWKRQDIYDRIRYVEHKDVTKSQVDNIPKTELYMKFSDSIDWKTLLAEDRGMYEYWKVVADWVNWFSQSYLNIKDAYQHSKQWTMDDDDIAPILMSKYGINRKLTDYLIKSFK